MRNLWSFLLLIFTAGYPQILAAQSSINWVEVITSDLTIDSSSYNLNQSISVLETKLLSFELADTANVSTVQIRLGTTANGNDVFDQSFPANTNVSSSPSIWYERVGITCKVGLGIWNNLEQCYITIKTFDPSGNTIGLYSSIAY
jgi:hypothetical protein